MDFVLNLYMREMQVHFVRFFRSAEMSNSGGIYVDLDYDSYTSLVPYLQANASHASVAMLARGPQWDENLCNDGILKHILANAFMASTPAHSF